MNRIILKDVSGFEAWETYWNNEVQIKEIVYKGDVVNLYKHPIFNFFNIKNQMDAPHYVLMSILDVLNIQYNDNNESVNDYNKYLIELINKNEFEVLFEAHDELIKYETKGIVSIFNPSFKLISEWDDFIFAGDEYNSDVLRIFNKIKAEDILNYYAFGKETASFIADIVLNNAINTYKDSLSFYKMLYDKLPPQT